MKKIISLLLIICCAATMMATTVSPDAEYQLIRRTYVVYADGSVDYTFHKELKLLRNRAITAYADKGETFITYNPAFESLTINESYTLRADGIKVPTPKNAFVEQLPSQCAGSARLSGIREMVVVHTALEYDAIIVLDYTIHRAAGCALEEMVVLAEDCPVKRSELIIDLPNKSLLSVHERNLNLSRRQAAFSINGNHAYELIVLNIPQTYNDSYLPKPEKIYPTVCFTNRTHNAFEKFPEETIGGTEAWRQQARTDNLLTTATNIRNHVVDHIRWNNIPMALLHNQTATAQEVYTSGCGNTLEKNLLLAALLRGEGINAEVVVPQRSLPLKNAQDNRRFELSQPERAYVLATIDGMPYRMSATDKSAPRLTNIAEDLTDTLKVKKTLAFNDIATALSNGYYSLTLPTEAESYQIDASLLSSNRRAPLLAKRVYEEYLYTIPLPEGVEMVGKPIKVKKSSPSCKMKIVIRQNGNTIEVVRRLQIFERHIDQNYYKAFRQTLIKWNAYNSIILKTR